MVRGGQGWFALCAVTLALAFATACDDGPCSAMSVAGLDVNILNASGEPVCDATVIARQESTFSEQLQLAGSVPNCFYRGLWDRNGTYLVDVTSGPESKSLREVKVSRRGCHVVTKVVTVTLDQ